MSKSTPSFKGENRAYKQMRDFVVKQDPGQGISAFGAYSDEDGDGDSEREMEQWTRACERISDRILDTLFKNLEVGGLYQFTDLKHRSDHKAPEVPADNGKQPVIGTYIGSISNTEDYEGVRSGWGKAFEFLVTTAEGPKKLFMCWTSDELDDEEHIVLQALDSEDLVIYQPDGLERIG
jgi:hypothetical protein